jgi:hypothetical protein
MAGYFVSGELDPGRTRFGAQLSIRAVERCLGMEFSTFASRWPACDYIRTKRVNRQNLFNGKASRN